MGHNGKYYRKVYVDMWIHENTEAASAEKIKNIRIRMAKPEDAEQILSIYAPYVENTPITFEYEVPSPEEFRLRITHTLEKYPYLVAVSDRQEAFPDLKNKKISKNPGERILGYAYAGAFKGRAAYDWAVETSIYVRGDIKGCGIGSKLYQALEDILRKQHIVNVNACITYPNPQSISFHEKSGYRQVAHFTKCGYKLGKWHDMIWMEKMLGEHPEQPEPVLPAGQVTSGYIDDKTI